MADFSFENHGSIMLVTPHTDEAKAWVDENLGLESWQWLGGGFACEPRYASDLADNMMAEGYTVS